MHDFIAYKNGSIAARTHARNMDSSGNVVENSFQVIANKNGTASYQVTSPAAFRGAIELGTTAPGTVLWQDFAYMQENQTADLSANISTCPTGIVLHWQTYASGAVQNYNHNYYFVPKTHVASYNGGGIAQLMMNGDGTKIGRKYVYVYDDRIVGNSNNTATDTASGITFVNNFWVLTQVIAV